MIQAKAELEEPTLELEVAKEMLSELFAVETHEVDEMIQRRIEYRELYGEELNPI